MNFLFSSCRAVFPKKQSVVCGAGWPESTQNCNYNPFLRRPSLYGTAARKGGALLKSPPAA